jgi:hypothetical protein
MITRTMAQLVDFHTKAMRDAHIMDLNWGLNTPLS